MILPRKNCGCVSYAVEDYVRSWEQNEELGLNDMDTSSADDAYNSANVEPNKKTDAWLF